MRHSTSHHAQGATSLGDGRFAFMRNPGGQKFVRAKVCDSESQQEKRPNRWNRQGHCTRVPRRATDNNVSRTALVHRTNRVYCRFPPLGKFFPRSSGMKTSFALDSGIFGTKSVQPATISNGG